jgi:hypothetical protein
MDTTREAGHATSMRGGYAAQRVKDGGDSYVMRASHFSRHSCHAAAETCLQDQVYRSFFMDLCYSSFPEQGVQLRRIAVD